MAERTAGPFTNYGEMLYAESMQALNSRQQAAEAARMAREAAELSEVTFQPTVNSRSDFCNLRSLMWLPHLIDYKCRSKSAAQTDNNDWPSLLQPSALVNCG